MKLITFLLIILGFVLGVSVGQVFEPQSYSAGFIDAFRSAPKECRAELLNNYLSLILKGAYEKIN